ncbi:MAG TPA: hypothetical protein VKU91_10200 [Acidimicrobiales bacterium]|nr:hypothetical protein [Acidimicrobiales bacterium]
MSDDPCSQLEDVAAEVALGLLGGTQRAAALDHLQSCSRCQALIDDMATVGDNLLLLAPEVEPPAGFETRALEGRLGPAARPVGNGLRGGLGRPRARRRIAAAAAAGAAGALAVAAAVGGLVAAGGAGGGGPGFRVKQPAAIAAMGGKSLEAAVLTEGSEPMGQVFAYGGRPSWLMMTVDNPGPPTRVMCQLVMTGGSRVDAGTFNVGSYASWGVALTVDPTRIASVRLVGASGATVAVARF